MLTYQEIAKRIVDVPTKISIMYNDTVITTQIIDIATYINDLG